jgi:phage gp37-like protein
MYNNVVTSVRTSNGDIDDSSIRMITSRVSFEPLRFFCLGDG